jgi:lysophospholipase L1-like esterase
MKHPVLLLAGMALACSAAAAPSTSDAPRPPVRVILVGDSTMASKSGYGDALCGRFTPEVTCINKARGGRSTSSFRKEGHWDEIQQTLRDKGAFAASYVLVQFGHNDQPGKPGRSTDLATEFPVNMARYALETTSLGAVPVLVTPLTRRSFEGAELRDTLGPWAEATRKAAAAEHAPLLDLNADSSAAVQAMGQVEADTLSPPQRLASEPAGEPKGGIDRTHLGRKGAEYFARMVERELTQAVPELAPYFRKD